MACPFLTEGRAQYCHAAPMRKLILDGPGVTGGGLCTSLQYQQCEFVAKNSIPRDRCPHLEEVRVQYCAASPIPKLVPFSDSQLSSCSSGSYRYCDSYLALARPRLQISSIRQTTFGSTSTNRAVAISALTVFWLMQWGAWMVSYSQPCRAYIARL